MNDKERITELENTLSSIRDAVVETSAHTVIGSCIISTIDSVMRCHDAKPVENEYVLYMHSLVSNAKVATVNAVNDDIAMRKASELIGENDSRSFMLIDHHRMKKFNYQDGKWCL